jgi:hypothetical protein
MKLWTPTGRIVQGNPLVEQTKGYQGKPLVTKTGNPRVEFFFALAVAKNFPETADFWAKLKELAAQEFPEGQHQWPQFSWKVIDGDVPPHKGKEGFAGNYVIRLNSGFKPQMFTRGGGSPIVDPDQVKPGYYARAYISAKGNGDKTGKPGIYLNPSVVELVGYGEEIQTGVDGRALIGEAPAATVPDGASATPPTPTPPTPPAPTPPAPTPPAPTPPAPTPPAPAPDYLDPFGLVPTEKARGIPLDQWRAQGWSDRQLLRDGIGVPSADDDIPF